MGVITAADEHRDAAIENVDDAIKHISTIVVDCIWGWDHYSKEYFSILRAALRDLLDIREHLRQG